MTTSTAEPTARLRATPTVAAILAPLSMAVWTASWIGCGAAGIPPDPSAAVERRERSSASRQAAEDHLERELGASSGTSGNAPTLAGRADAADAQLDEELAEPSVPHATSALHPVTEVAPTPVEAKPPPPPAPRPFTEPRWVEASGAAYLQSRSADEAEHLALRKALENAVRIAAGEKIDVTQLQIVTENDNQLRDAFIQVSEVDVQGYVTEYHDLRWESLSVENPDKTRPPIPGFVAHINAYVVPPKGERDGAFWIRVGINNVTLREEDDVVFTVNSSQDAYITMLNIQSKGEVVVVIPYSPYVEELFIRQSESMTFPSQEMREGGFHLRAQVPEGMDAVAESFLIVATRERVAPPQPEDGSQLDITDLNRWLANIPRNRRAEDVVVFDIHRN